ncbi:MAG: PspA/IM30 family protein [Gammaproteobacteria bacterium]
MSDSIATRVTRIITGSVNALLDAVESAAPEAIMTQAVREVDEAIDEVRGELGRVEAGKHLVASRLKRLDAESEEIAAQTELAVAKGHDDLARAGIARQVDIEDQIPVLQRSLQEARDRSRELEGYITALLAKKREMEATLNDLIAARAAPVAASGAPRAASATQAKVERAGAVFDRVVARETGAQGVIAGVAADAQQLAELQDLARSHRIEERLAALKAHQGQAD